MVGPTYSATHTHVTPVVDAGPWEGCWGWNAGPGGLWCRQQRQRPQRRWGTGSSPSGQWPWGKTQQQCCSRSTLPSYLCLV